VKLLVALLALASVSCVSMRRHLEPLASARVAPDYETYTVRRVGLLPFCGEKLAEEQSTALQSAFLAELSRTSGLEIVPLQAADLEEIPASEPFRVGWIQPRTVIDIARRYRLDAILIGTVSERQYFTPQRLGVQLDMVAAETGLAIWSASVHLDASDERVREGVEQWFRTTRAAEETGETWELCLLSPRRFAQFAAYEIAREL
jgi:hypothetical protein